MELVDKARILCEFLERCRDDVIWYYTSALAVFESAFGADHVLVRRLSRVVAEMKKV